MSEIFSGNTIMIENLGNSKAKLNKIGGSWQKTRSGKNKFNKKGDFNYGNSNTNKTTLLSDGTIKTTTNYQVWISAGYRLVNILPNTKYTLSGTLVSSTGTGYENIAVVTIRGYKDGTWKDAGIAWIGVVGKFSCTFDTKDYEDFFVSFNSRGLEEGSYEAIFDNIQIEQGTKVTEYEEYGASPSPEFRSEIRNVGDNVNLYDKDNPNILNTPIDSNGLGVNAGDTYKTVYIECEPNETYTISKKYDETKNRFTVAYTEEEPTYSMQVLGHTFATTLSEVTIKTGANAKYLLAYVWLNGGTTTYQEMLDSIKIEKGTKATPYSPYNCGNFNETVCNGNFFDESKSEINKCIYAGGSILNDSSMNTSDYIDVSKFISYVISFTSDSTKDWNICYFDKDFNVVSGGYNGLGSRKFTKDVPTGVKFIRFSYPNNSTEIMVSSKDTSYIPHQSQQFTFPLKPGQRMYKDSYLAHDGVHHKRGRYYLKNANFMLSANHENNSVFQASAPDGLKFVDETSLCNIATYEYLESASIKMNKIYTFMINDKSYIRMATADKTLEDFKAMIEETGAYIEHALKEEVIEPYTAEQENVYMQLQNMELYEGINNIFIEGEPYAEIEVAVTKLIEDYDSYISSNGRLIVPGSNINYLVDLSESDIPTMPEAVESSVRVAGRDGDVPLKTTYEPMSYSIVCYTEDNLSLLEKVEEEKKINKLLNSIKDKTMTFALEKSNKFYNVKYSGALTTINYPKHLKFSIPLKASDSYGKDLIKKSIVGNSIGESETAEKVGALFILRGPATNPIIALNDYSMEYGMAILEGARVEIDSNKSTITHINSSGIKTNVMKYYNHQFPKIENGINELKILSGFDSDMQVSVIWNDLKL